MSYYTYILAKYDVSDCKTFEDVKSKFPDRSPAFLRKVMYIKGLSITREGRLEGVSEEGIAVQQDPSKRRKSVRPIRGSSSKKQKRKRYPKVNCPQCGKEIFLVYPNDPFCSAKCRREYKKTRAEELEEPGSEHVKEVKAWGKLRPELAKRENILTTSQKRLRFLETPDQKLSEEIVAYVREASSGYPFYDKRLRGTINKFWINKHPYVFDYWTGLLPSRLRSEINSKKDEAASLAHQIIFNDRKQYLDSLTQKLIQWALEREIRRLTRTDVKVFLMKQGIKLPISAENMLYREAKLKYRYLPPWKR